MRKNQPRIGANPANLWLAPRIGFAYPHSRNPASLSCSSLHRDRSGKSCRRPSGSFQIKRVFLIIGYVPTGGTTEQEAILKEIKAISIHVPTGGTTLFCGVMITPCYFNPRAHGGHDRQSVLKCGPFYFNPRAHGGHDVLNIAAIPFL